MYLILDNTIESYNSHIKDNPFWSCRYKSYEDYKGQLEVINIKYLLIYKSKKTSVLGYYKNGWVETLKVEHNNLFKQFIVEQRKQKLKNL
jgi:hypothetical protein